MKAAFLFLYFYLLTLAMANNLSNSIQSGSLEIARKETLMCPGVCREGKGGFVLAKRECSKSRCFEKDVKCKVQVCSTSSVPDGYKCDCPAALGSCPDICRTGTLGRISAKKECKQKPTCDTTGRRCRVAHCTLDGLEGVKCACPDPEETPEV